MAVTIQDIAHHLELAPSTVSKALNGYPHISAKTRERVIESAQSLGYIPSAAARNLRRQRTDKIGVSFSFPIPLMRDYASSIILGAITTAEQQGYNLTLYPSQDDQVKQLRQICGAREVDGILLFGRPQMAETTVPLLKEEGIPFVVVGREVQDPTVSYVKSDDVSGARAVTAHLIEQGHRRIAFTTRPEVGATSRERFSGYRQALEEAGVPFNPELVLPTTLEPDSGYRVMNALLDLAEPPTAVFAIHDLVAMECLRAISDRKLQIPQDIAIAGFDNWRISLTTQPPLTTVNAPLDVLGGTATEILLRQINNPDAPATRLSLPVDLVVRQSTQAAGG